MRARPESTRARDERKRGISVPTLPCGSLVVYGDAFREERGKPVVRLYGSDELDFPGLDHWGLVSDVRVCAKIAEWLAAATPRLALPTRRMDFQGIRARLLQLLAQPARS